MNIYGDMFVRGEQKKARSINLARFTFLDPGSLFVGSKSYWIHEGLSKYVQVSSCGQKKSLIFD